MSASLAVEAAVAMNSFHAAIVAEGYTNVAVVEMLPRYISFCPRIASTASVGSSPPTTVTLELGPQALGRTSPVSFSPKMNSRTSVRA